MQNMREKLRRKLSMKDANPNYDEFNDEDDVDDETHRHLQREMQKAEENHEEPYGKSGSFLNKLIMHGNKKTEEEMRRESAMSSAGAGAENQKPGVGGAMGGSGAGHADSSSGKKF
ncbi:hypothetical protein LTR91_021255 [Friedmanniomyces endolithicus]|uniref:Uncharacterized protein n=1 Tax=Friedmanniomyces endolithicus TaxID=329885 RepID=A0A4U0UA93_9PEZI|nr:hypothetical protein LTS09_006056 [Friedmanniomyces endolithicus]KAK0277485.1 hypothetical protein LTR35_009887 [Friedmanniomyces endolithicus]KAK0283217.1 hypothetical protein LTS00_011821 [Friedmanniomyces endolithicus]KAK0311239.1 hypothetical protein LTR01_003234 [Friedmanniomyces endolithicus]KAK0320027.1 hypothetical protein LTR82_008962 [Friedmanniomyces endolithicus]